jgi:antitoxin component YwqK of YwqJK toxin-antitoxin module
VYNRDRFGPREGRRDLDPKMYRPDEDEDDLESNVKAAPKAAPWIIFWLSLAVPVLTAFPALAHLSSASTGPEALWFGMVALYIWVLLTGLCGLIMTAASFVIAMDKDRRGVARFLPIMIMTGVWIVLGTNSTSDVMVAVLDLISPSRNVGSSVDGSRFTESHPNGAVVESGSYADGKKNGPYELRFRGRVIETGSYVDGRKNGPFVFYTFYSTRFDPDPPPLEGRGSYTDGCLDGPFEEYHQNGQLRIRGTYRADLIPFGRCSGVGGANLPSWVTYPHDYVVARDGAWEEYLSDGQLHTKGTYANGAPCGEWVGDPPNRWRNESKPYPPCPND